MTPGMAAANGRWRVVLGLPGEADAIRSELESNVPDLHPSVNKLAATVRVTVTVQEPTVEAARRSAVDALARVSRRAVVLSARRID